MADDAPPAIWQDEVLTFLVQAPTPTQIMAFEASVAAQARLRALLDANREGTLTADEHAELSEAMHVNHVVMLLKARAYKAIHRV